MEHLTSPNDEADHRKPSSYQDFSIGNYDQLNPAETEALLEQAHYAIFEGGERRRQAMELAAEASRQIADAQRVLHMLAVRIRTAI